MTMLKRHLFGYQGHVSAALVLGGVDVSGPHLYTIYPHGSTDKLPYVTMGSGSLAAMSVMETGYRDGMDEAQAKVSNARCPHCIVLLTARRLSGAQECAPLICRFSSPHPMLCGENVHVFIFF